LPTQAKPPANTIRSCSSTLCVIMGFLFNLAHSQARTEGALPGFVGSFSYVERNLFGLNQKLSAVAELGQVGVPGTGVSRSV
jgi:hypothetical protein